MILVIVDQKAMLVHKDTRVVKAMMEAKATVAVEAILDILVAKAT